MTVGMEAEGALEAVPHDAAAPPRCCCRLWPGFGLRGVLQTIEQGTQLCRGEVWQKLGATIRWWRWPAGISRQEPTGSH